MELEPTTETDSQQPSQEMQDRPARLSWQRPEPRSQHQNFPERLPSPAELYPHPEFRSLGIRFPAADFPGSDAQPMVANCWRCSKKIRSRFDRTGISAEARKAVRPESEHFRRLEPGELNLVYAGTLR